MRNGEVIEINTNYSVIKVMPYDYKIDFYVYNRCGFILPQNDEYICVDNCIYDKNLDCVFECGISKRPVEFIDALCGLIAYRISGELHVFQYFVTIDNNRSPRYAVNEIPYYLYKNNEKEKLNVRIIRRCGFFDLDILSYIYFDMEKFEFAIDKERISEYLNERKKHSYSEYSLLDALDGDYDAY